MLAATGMILGAYYLMWMLRRVIFGPLREPGGHDGHGGREGPSRSTSTRAHAMCPARGSAGTRSPAWRRLMFLIVAIGVYPRPIFEQIRPAVDSVLRDIAVSARPGRPRR